ncbi:MAG: primosomal protein N', partial [Flavobacteriales bacterium]|nr:primosomal protein N' [Flavobacteriales bacterium]
RVPSIFNEEVEVGKRVLVQFGKKRIYTGIISTIHQIAPSNYQAKYIEAVLDEYPIVTSVQIEFWKWLAAYYFATIGDVMNAALPSGLKLSSSSFVSLNHKVALDEFDYETFSSSEHEILNLLQNQEEIDIENIAKKLGKSSIQKDINKLVKKGVLEVFEEVQERYKPKLVKYIAIHKKYQDESEFQELLSVLEKRAFKQLEVLLAIKRETKNTNQEYVKKSIISKGYSGTIINQLIKKEVLIEEIREQNRTIKDTEVTSEVVLSKTQKDAFEKIKDGFAKNKTVLLHGVTGSGKTEIYIELIKERIQKGQQALFLIPEIALTYQLISRLRKIFGNSVGVYHSKFNENERVEIWNEVLNFNNRNNNANYQIVGARSALLLPFSNLGLIIVDEEHDYSFKQNSPSPRYHARDAAMYLAKKFEANVVLGTATPSMESYYNSITNKFIRVSLSNKYYATEETSIKICDIRKNEDELTMHGVLTKDLYNAIVQTLQKNRQVILFQNRRGFAPYTQCRLCGHVIYCK